MSNLKQTKTYWIITEKDDLYLNEKYKDRNGKGQPNPTKGQSTVNGKWYFRFPEQFIQSTNRKWIVVQHALLSYQNSESEMKMTDDVILHSSFVKRDPYVDHAVMLCNEVRTKYKKYEYISHDPNFEIWFTSFAKDGFVFPYDTTKFFIELMLIY